MNEAKTTYKGTEIVYSKLEDRWKLTRDGMERFGTTLTEAKKKIDVQDRKKNNFPIAVFFSGGYHGRVVQARVTSIDEGGSHYRNCRVVVEGNRSSTLECSDDLYAVTSENTKFVGEYNQIRDQIKALEEKADKIKERLTLAVIPGIERNK
jgi:hexokinase